MRNKVALSLSLLVLAGPLWARSRAAHASPERLAALHRQMDAKRVQLERYRKECAELEAKLSGQAESLQATRAERGRLQDLHRGALARKRRLAGELRGLQAGLQGVEARAEGLAGLYYQRALTDEPYYGRGQLFASAALGQNIAQDFGRMQTLQDRRDRVSGQAREAELKAEGLSVEAVKETQNERRSRLKLEAKERELKQAQARLAQTRRELEGLESSARKMDELLVRLAREAAKRRAAAEARAQARKPHARTAPKVRLQAGAAWAKHSLPWPAPGRVLAGYGKQRVESLGAWMLNRGLRLATPMGQAVSAVAPGQVIYAGEFRGYGRVVIVDHEGDWVSVYGHLGSLAKAAGDAVGAGEAVGTAGQPQDALPQLVSIPEGRSSLYFEIRRGGRAVDPLKWLERR